jgi:hypothetical protein
MSGNTFGVNISLSAIRFEEWVRERKQCRITDLNHNLLHRLITFAIREPVIQIEDLEGIRENSS